MPSEFKYWAFISYSHQDNRKARNLWGDWLHYAVENFKVPSELVGKLGRYDELVPVRLFPAFQDEKELPTNADLGVAINEALKQSRYLVLICSPRAAKSVYVNQEVLEFKRLGRSNRILAIIVDGEPNASEPGKGFDPALECFPPALRHPLGVDGNLDLTRHAEPIAADVRGDDGKEALLKDKSHHQVLEREKLRVMAGLLGIGFDELVQRDKERQLKEAQARTRRLRRLVAGFATLALAAMVAGVVAISQKHEADKQRQEAVAQKQEAVKQKQEALQMLSQSDFLQAQRLIAEDNNYNALAYLARSLSANSNNSAALTRLTTLLAYRSWMVPRLILKHRAKVNSAQFSSDGKKILTTLLDDACSAQLWNAQTGQLLIESLNPAAPVYRAQFSVDGGKILTISKDKVWVMDSETGRLLIDPLKHGNDIYSAQFSPDGKKILSVGGDDTNRTARVWDAQTGQMLMEPLTHKNDIYSAQFSPDGKKILMASEGMIWVLNAETGQSLMGPLKHDSDAVDSFQCSPDGEKIVSAWLNKTNGTGTVRVWDAQTGQLLMEALKHDGPVQSAQFNPDGKKILMASEGMMARIWNMQTSHSLVNQFRSGDGVSSAEFSPDGKRIVSASGETAELWDAGTGQSLTEPLRHNGEVLFAHFIADGSRIITIYGDDRTNGNLEAVRLWDAQTGNLVTEPLKPDSGFISAKISMDGRNIVTISYDNTVRVWDSQTGQPLTEPLKHDDVVYSAQFSPDAKRIVTTSGDHTVRVWDAQTGQLLLSKPYNRATYVMSAEFSPDGKLIVTTPSDSINSVNTVEIWDARTGLLMIDPLKHDYRADAVTFSSDSKKIVTVAEKARVWDVQSGRLLAVLSGDGVSSAEFSPDNRRFVIVSFGDMAQVWDAQTCQPLTEPLKHGDDLRSAKFSPNGNRIVTASVDKTVRVWDIAPTSTRFPDWFIPLTEAISGEVLDAQSVLEPTKLNRVGILNQTRQKLNQSPNNDDWTVWGRWFLADPATRTISPFSKVTVPQYIEECIKENTTFSLDEAESLAFGNTNLLQWISKTRAKLEQKPSPEPNP